MIEKLYSMSDRCLQDRYLMVHLEGEEAFLRKESSRGERQISRSEKY